jgi:hypothetical protein
MTLSETLALLRMKEKKTGRLLENAISLKRHRKNSNIDILRNAEAYYLPTVNSRARVKWGTTFIEEIFRFFEIADDQQGPLEPLFLVTIADKGHGTTDQPQRINLPRIKRKIGAGLMGLSYIGMIEPGYYNVIRGRSDPPGARRFVYGYMGNCWRKRSVLTKVKNASSAEVFVVGPVQRSAFKKSMLRTRASPVGAHLFTQQFGRAFSKDEGLQITTNALSNAPQPGVILLASLDLLKLVL